MWKYLFDSVQGTAHFACGTGLQDTSFVCQRRFGADEVLIAACSDGAGSARHAKAGSEAACAGVLRQVTQFFEDGNSAGDLRQELALQWYERARQEILREAAALDSPPRQLACTLLLAVVAPQAALFAQLGDGAIVYHDGVQCCPVFWPQTGEYQNSTHFLTDDAFKDHMQARCLPRRLNQLAMFTDGLQMLALNYSEKSAHQPFFTPLFHALQEASNHLDLSIPLRAFLDSEAINQRTDDDKTLVLAVRAPDGQTTV
jgi:hypothetical protein